VDVRWLRNVDDIVRVDGLLSVIQWIPLSTLATAGENDLSPRRAHRPSSHHCAYHQGESDYVTRLFDGVCHALARSHLTPSTWSTPTPSSHAVESTQQDGLPLLRSTRRYLGRALVSDTQLIGAEMRNRVYDLVAMGGSDNELSSCHRLSLAYTCRQIRDDYKPIGMKSPLIINWRDVPKFLETFYLTVYTHVGDIEHAPTTIDRTDVPRFFDLFGPTVSAKVENIEHAPSFIIIIADECNVGGQPVSIDYLPFVKMHHSNSSFDVSFRLPPQAGSESGSKRMLRNLLCHRSPDWLEAFPDGEVARMMLSPVAWADGPVVITLVLVHDGISAELQGQEEKGLVSAYNIGCLYRMGLSKVGDYPDTIGLNITVRRVNAEDVYC
jgi:hypothetical protein